MIIKGQWHEPGSAAQCEAALRVEGDDFKLVVVDGPNFDGQLTGLKISDRLGNVERKVTLENGSVFASQDNDAIDAWLNQQKYQGQSKSVAILHSLESNLSWVLIAIVMTLVTSVSFFRWGVPWVSTQIAYALPHQANEVIAAHTLEFLDDFFFAESQLKDQQQESIETYFELNILSIAEHDSEFSYALHFRQWGEGDDAIPNALALPSGDIILTDRFVELSQNQDEIGAVLLHEIGHVVYRHTLETVVQGAIVATVVMMATGDGNGLADMGVGLGSVLVSSAYSRDNESEADLYAFNMMLAAGIDPNAFSRIMQAIADDIEKAVPTDTDQQNSNSKKDREGIKIFKPERAKDSGILDYLSSHPSTEKRIQQAESFSQCFKQGLKVCDISDSE
ncbi:MAG: Zn-dependent protease with chaperone function [Dinoroseobacter sp.]